MYGVLRTAYGVRRCICQRSTAGARSESATASVRLLVRERSGAQVCSMRGLGVLLVFVLVPLSILCTENLYVRTTP